MAKQTNRGKPKQIDLAVLETTEWYTKDRTLTVRPLFQMLTQIIYDNPNWFHYATFMGSASFVEALENLVHKDGVNYIYIGAHGQDDKIQRVKSEKAIRAVLESLQRRGYGEMMDALGFTVYIGGKEIYFGDRETAFGDSDGEEIENDDEA